MVYLVYKTTNTINGKYYIGIHKQKDALFDGYYGSGVLLHSAIKKYGVSNFIRETLFSFDTWEEARIKEREIVTEEFCQRRDTYNISVGGGGGDTMAGYSYSQRKVVSEKRKLTNELCGNYVYSGQKLIDAQDRMLKCRIQPDNRNKKHTGEALLNMREASTNRTGIYMWINDGNTTVIHLKKDPIPDGWRCGRGPDCGRFISHTEESKQKISSKIKGDVCYNNGIVNLKLKQGDIPPEGYVRGMIQSPKNTIWITDGTNSKMHKKTAEIPDGWYKGRTILKENS